MSTEQQPARPSRGGGGAAPVGSTVAIVVAVAAVVLGFFILRDLRDGGGAGGGAGGGGSSSTTTPDDTNTPSSVVPTDPPASSLPPDVFEGATVVVANASGVPQSAARWTTDLKGAKFTTGEAANAAAGENRLETSKVYYQPGPASEAVAATLARLLGDVDLAPMPATVPVEGGSIEPATVLLMLGKDIAAKNLSDVIAGGVGGGDTTSSTSTPSGATTTPTSTPG